MKTTYVDEKSLKTLEDYAVLLVTGILSLNTLHNFQVKSVQSGILPDDGIERANTIAWDLRRCMKQFQTQLENVLEFVPDDFNIENILENMKKNELTKARSLTRKSKIKE